MLGIRTNKQTTREDRAAQLVICETLSLAIDCNSRVNRIRLYHTHYFYQMFGWSLVDLVLEGLSGQQHHFPQLGLRRIHGGRECDTVACTRIGEMRDRVKRYRRSSVLSEAAATTEGKTRCIKRAVILQRKMSVKTIFCYRPDPHSSAPLMGKPGHHN